MKKTILILSISLAFALNSFSQHSVGKAPIAPHTAPESTPFTDVVGIDMAYAYEAGSSNFTRFPLSDFSVSEVLFNQSFSGFIGTAEYVPEDSYYFIDQADWNIYKADFDLNTATLHAAITDPDLSHSSSDGGVTGIAYHKNTNTFYVSVSLYTNEGLLYTLNIDTGVLSYVGSIGSGMLLIDIAIDVDGNLYGIDIIGNNLYSINTSTGAGSLIGSIGFDANFGQSMDFDDDANILYYSAFNNGTFSAQMRTVDTSTGNTTLVHDFGFLQYTAFTVKRAQSVSAVPIPYYMIAFLFVLLTIGILVRRRFF